MKLMIENVTEEDRKRHMAQDDKCHAKASQRGQTTFTLVEQDRTTPKTICFWIMENIETAPAAKLFDALESAIIARSFPNRKYAD